MSRRSSGFTLLEVLVAIAVLGLILVLLTQAVQVGARALGSFSGAVQAQSDLVPVERALRAMIERADPGVYPEPAEFRGTANALAFTTELPDTATGGTIAADVRLQASDGALLLLWTPHRQGVPFGPLPAPRRTVLLEQLARLQFDYAAPGAGAAWRTSWAEEALPGLIRIWLVPTAHGASWPPIIARPLRERAEE